MVRTCRSNRADMLGVGTAGMRLAASKCTSSTCNTRAELPSMVRSGGSPAAWDASRSNIQVGTRRDSRRRCESYSSQTYQTRAFSPSILRVCSMQMQGSVSLCMHCVWCCICITHASYTIIVHHRCAGELFLALQIKTNITTIVTFHDCHGHVPVEMQLALYHATLQIRDGPSRDHLPLYL